MAVDGGLKLGTEASARDEWIELYNPTDQSIDLQGWTLASDDGSPAPTLDGTISAEGFYLLERTDDQTVSDVDADKLYTGNLSNSGESLTLKDSSGNVISTANADGSDWPAGDNSTHATMERIDPAASGDDANWATNDGSAQNGQDANGNAIRGTPKAVNSVTPTNQAPTCVDVTARTEEDRAVTVDLDCTDPDGDTLTYEIRQRPSHGSAQLTNGRIDYVPDPNFHGTDTLTYRASDGSAQSEFATATVTVEPVNDPPVAQPAAVTTDAGTAVKIELSATDVDDDELTFQIMRQPANGTLSDVGLMVTYTPNPGFVGQDSFTYVANDGQARSNEATVTVDVRDRTPTGDGDPDDDGAADAIDARICLQIAKGVGSFSSEQQSACDVDGDGSVGRDDAETIARATLGLSSDLGAAAALAGLTLFGLALPLALRRSDRAHRLLLLTPGLVAISLVMTGCPSLIPALPDDAVGIKATVSSEAIHIAVQNMPNGGVAALEVGGDGLSFNGDVLRIQRVEPADGWTVLARDIDNGSGHVQVVAVQTRGGTADGRILTLPLATTSGFSRGAADVAWDPAQLTLGDAANAEITDFQTGTQP
ncbi:MAG: Ig-like domain-containing protein [Salinibacter sp.]